MKSYHLSTTLSINTLFLAFFLIAFQSQSAFAQVKIDQAKEVLNRKANNRYVFEEYHKALPLYLKLLEKDPNSFLYNSRVGICYLKSNIQTVKSIPYFEKALKAKSLSDGATSEFYFYVGFAYQISNQFEKAIKNYTLSKTFPNVNDSLVNISLQQCKIGKVLINTPSRGRIYNLGDDINSIYPDYAPVMLRKKSQLIFASTRKGSSGGLKLISSGEYFEDIYKVSSVPNKETPNVPEFSTNTYKIGDHINTALNDAPITITPNDFSLLLFRRNRVMESTVYASHLSIPTKYKNSPFSSKNVGSSITFSKDGQTMYFVDSKPGGYGGKDIYKSLLQADGTWGEAINLGNTINTPYNEESPFYDQDKQTLYFSSTGHNSMGGFDVFEAEWAQDHWKAPKNLGYPINSGSDEIGFTYDSKTNTGYYSTMRPDGVGNYDVYMVRFLKPLDVFATATFKDDLTPKELKIQVENITDGEKYFFNLNDKNTIQYKSNCSYQLLVPHYDSEVIVDTLNFETPETMGDHKYYQVFNYEEIKNSKDSLVGYLTTVYNVFFNIEGEIVKRGLRNKQVTLHKFPACGTNDSKFAYYKNKEITTEEEYSSFINILESQFEELEGFEIYDQINYIDTSSFVTDSLLYEPASVK